SLETVRVYNVISKEYHGPVTWRRGLVASFHATAPRRRFLLTPDPVACTVSNYLHRRKKAARIMLGSTFQTIAIVLYFAGMLTIGYFAYRRTKNNLDGYMLADRGLRPGVAALSAGASDMSGWLLMGLPGAIYMSGLIEAWIAIGLTIGAWLNWKFVA